ncbi:MAG: PDZ domain-containing protein [Actinobacteria bacterium]|nr:PDZ domain-containing protein [Actinomycetota bacterium]
MGFTWDQINAGYRKRYKLEGYHDDHVVVTRVTPNSAADQAGLREGDEILDIDGRRVRWGFEVWGIVAALKKQPVTPHPAWFRLDAAVVDGHGRISARDSLLVYLYK